MPGNHASGLGGLETFPGGALYDCLRPVTTYPGKRASIPSQGPSVTGQRTISAACLLLKTKHSRLEAHVQSASIPKEITVSLWDNIA